MWVLLAFIQYMFFVFFYLMKCAISALYCKPQMKTSLNDNLGGKGKGLSSNQVDQN